MSAIASYADLQTKLQEIIDTSDPEVTALIPYSIAQVEERINADPDFRVSQMSERWTATTSGNYVNLPPDMLEIRRLHTTINGETWTLDYYTPEQATDLIDDGSTAPFGYTITSNLIQFVPTPAAEFTYELAYYARLEPLSVTNTSNWLLANYSHIYLAGALAELYLILFEEERAAIHQQRYTDFVSKLKSADHKKKYSGNSLRIRVA